MSCIELAAGCLSTLILTTSWFFATQNCWLWFISQWFEYFDWAFDPERVVLSDSIRPRVGNIVFVDWLCVSRKLLFSWTDLALGHHFDPTCLLRACQIVSALLSVLFLLHAWSWCSGFLSLSWCIPPPTSWHKTIMTGEKWTSTIARTLTSNPGLTSHSAITSGSWFLVLTKLQYSSYPSYLTKPAHYIFTISSECIWAKQKFVTTPCSCLTNEKSLSILKDQSES